MTEKTNETQEEKSAKMASQIANGIRTPVYGYCPTCKMFTLLELFPATSTIECLRCKRARPTFIKEFPELIRFNLINQDPRMLDLNVAFLQIEIGSQPGKPGKNVVHLNTEAGCVCRVSGVSSLDLNDNRLQPPWANLVCELCLKTGSPNGDFVFQSYVCGECLAKVVKEYGTGWVMKAKGGCYSESRSDPRASKK